jgi:hypothetical protein
MPIDSIRSAALSATAEVADTVTVPEWGGVTVGFKSPTVAERARLLTRYQNDETGQVDQSILQVLVVIMTVCDPETGEAVFAESDLDALLASPAGPVGRLFLRGFKLTGLSSDAVDEGKDDSSASPARGSRSSSPNASAG